MRTTLVFFSIAAAPLVASTQAPATAWTAQSWGLSAPTLSAVSHDDDGNVYVLGRIAGGNFGFEGFQIPDEGIYRAYLAKLDNSGTLVWIKAFPTTPDGSVTSTGMDATGSGSDARIAIVGNFTDSLTFDPSHVLVQPSGCDPMYLALFDGDGNVLDARAPDCAFVVNGNDVAFDPEDQSMVVVGAVIGSISWGSPHTPAGPAMFITKLNPDASEAWSQLAVGSDGFASCAATAVQVYDGAIYWTGDFSTSNALEGPGAPPAITGNYLDLMLGKFSSDGSPLLFTALGGGPGYDHASSIALFADGRIRVGGYFQGPATFGGLVVPGSATRDGILLACDTMGQVDLAASAGGAYADAIAGVGSDAMGSTYAFGTNGGNTMDVIADGSTIGSLPAVDQGDPYLFRLKEDNTWDWIKGYGTSYVETATAMEVRGHWVTVGGTIDNHVFVSRLDLDVYVHEVAGVDHFTVLPGPAAGQFTITCNTATNGLGYRVLDAVGRMVLEGGISGSSVLIDLGGRASGLHLVQLIGCGQVRSKRVLVTGR